MFVVYFICVCSSELNSPPKRNGLENISEIVDHLWTCGILFSIYYALRHTYSNLTYNLGLIWEAEPLRCLLAKQSFCESHQVIVLCNSSGFGHVTKWLGNFIFSAMEKRLEKCWIYGMLMFVLFKFEYLLCRIFTLNIKALTQLRNCHIVAKKKKKKTLA